MRPNALFDDVVETQDYPILYNACVVDTFRSVLEWNETNNASAWYDQIYPDLID